MLWALLLTPALAGLAAFVIRPNWPRRALTVLAAAALNCTVAAIMPDAEIAIALHMRPSDTRRISEAWAFILKFERTGALSALMGPRSRYR